MFASLVRFYHIDPRRLYDDIPYWMVSILIRQLPILEANEQLAAVDVAMAPVAKNEERMPWLNRLKAAVASRITPRKKPAIKVQEHDPVKAAEWFRQRGIKVIDGNE